MVLGLISGGEPCFNLSDAVGEASPSQNLATEIALPATKRLIMSLKDVPIDMGGGT